MNDVRTNPEIVGRAKREVLVPLTEARKAEIAVELADIGQEIIDEKVIAKNANGRANGLRADREVLDQKIRDDEEKVAMAVRFELHNVTIVTIREDTGEKVDEREATTEELQGHFDFKTAPDDAKKADEMAAFLLEVGNSDTDKEDPLIAQAIQLLGEGTAPEVVQRCGDEIDADVLVVAEAWEEGERKRKTVLAVIATRLIELGRRVDEDAEPPESND